MKKRFAAILIIVFVLGIAGTAFAAYPFSEVPTNHWSYNAVGKLVATGLVDGGGNKFNGDKTITRYEMAIIVAKAIDKQETATPEQKGLINKLVVEYNDELSNLGVRVQALGNNSDKIEKFQVGGYLGFRYDHRKNSGILAYANNLDVTVNYNIAKDLFITTETEINRNFKGAENDYNLWAETSYITSVGDGYLINAGRFKYVPTYGLVWDGKVSGIQATAGKKNLKTTVTFGRWVEYGVTDVGGGAYTYWGQNISDHYRALELAYAVSPDTNVKASYQKIDNSGTNAALASALYSVSVGNRGIYEVGFDTNVKQDLNLQVVGAKSDLSADNKAYRVQLRYKGANPFMAHTGDLFVSYNKIPNNAVIDSTDDYTNDFKGLWVGGHFVPRKGAMITTWYRSGKQVSNNAEKNIFRAQCDFFF
ncbi:MAG: S-layer protein [Firmicutes bacterium]|nr:S-layer protein [Bacillota bacterium]